MANWPTDDPAVLCHEFAAMGCRWSLWIAADEPTRVRSLSWQIERDVSDLSARWSRFDVASEVSRINRGASSGWVAVDREFGSLLDAAEAGWRETGGLFDIAAGSRSTDTGEPLNWSHARWDSPKGRLRFARSGVRLDVGGIAKGYAIDRIWDRYFSGGTWTACLSAGTSSVRAVGGPPGLTGWTVEIEDPVQARNTKVSRPTLVLRDRALSTSWNREADLPPDLVRPADGTLDERPGACTVIAANATRAEILSTALVLMSPEARAPFCAGLSADEAVLSWDFNSSEATPRWLTPPLP